jgi:hypothetical protein
MDMEGSHFPGLSPVAKIVGPLLVAAAIAAGGVGYAVREHHSAQSLATKNAQMTNQLTATQTEVKALADRVNALVASESKPNPAGDSAGTKSAGTPTPSGHAPTRRGSAQDPRFKKLQSELDAQGKEIDATRSDLANTQTDLQSARTELGGSIARTHGELVVLEKRGESNYFEFDLSKTKQFKREGPVGISLRKANSKRQYADLMLMVDDRNLQQKHVNLYQPAMFYEPDSAQPIEIVINEISKDHIHGYVSAPKYRKSELEAMANTNNNGGNNAPGQEQATNSGQGDSDIVNPNQPANATPQPTVRKRLPLPGEQPNQQEPPNPQ